MLFMYLAQEGDWEYIEGTFKSSTMDTDMYLYP